MKFTEKLIRLTAELSKAKVAKAAGLPASAISNYISKQQMPRGDTALALARALSVPVEWLLDDEANWPPPKSDLEQPITPTALSDGELMGEVLRRQRLAQVDLLEKIERAESIDWAGCRRRLSEIKPGASMPRDLAGDAVLVYSLFASYARALGQFEAKFYEALHGNILPPGLRKSEKLDLDRLNERYEKVLANPDFAAVMSDVEKRPNMRSGKDRFDLTAWSTLIKLATGEIQLKSGESLPSIDNKATFKRPT